MTELSADERAELQRAEDNWQRRWVEGIVHKSVGQAAKDVAARGAALLVWIDGNGELRAQRIERETSVIREFVPDFISRGRK